ncbi:hypothetical protein L596_002992 [Steinernema carpocapsae]|uniref:Uncharacterized protein n=1 Tax=Steinernema carpocapsae TaxID=34508 RepID=A0A4U8UR29_STECR|nr:hypothetical protein L596_002992 [Steinernema carpocapsae]
MVELKPNNVIRFGYGPEYVFEIPRAIPKSAKKVLQGHKGCLVAKDSSVSLPVVGRKILPALPLKPTAQQPPKPRKVRLVSADVVKPAEEKEKRNLLTSDRFSPVSRVRSASMDPSMAKNRAKKAENGRSSSKTDLTSKARVTPSPTSSANSSAEFSNSRRNTVLGTPFSRESDLPCVLKVDLVDYGAATNTNLLQRVVRLQMELHRRDLEINQLRDRILVNPTPAELSQKTTHPLSPMDAVFPDKIYKRTDSHPRSPIELQSPQTGPLKPLSALHSFESNQDRMNEMELEVRNDFLKLLAKSMTTLNDRLLSFPMRDYADIFSEMTRCLFEPLSYTVMETQKQCAENINRRYLLISERQAAHQQLESFMQNSIQPLIKQIEMILPVVRDAAMIARESVKVCNVFTAWSREFGDEIRTNGLTSNMLLNKADALLSRFKENSLTKHWLPPSLTPLLRVASLEFRKRIESRPVKLLTNSSSQTETECLEPERPQSSVKENVKVAHEPSKPRESKIPVKQHDAQSGILSNSKNVSKENKIEKLSMVTHLPVVERLLQETAPITPRSDCSSVSQKASTDSEQLSQLHKLARHLAKDVFQNLELRPNFSSEQSETDETEITTPKKSEASTTPRTPASTPTKLEHLPSGDFVKGAETSSDSSVQPKRSITKLSSIESSSSASMSLPAFLNSVAVMEPANEDQSVYSDLPLPESTQHRTIGDDPSLLQKDSNLLNLTYISHVRHDAPSRLSHRSEHHTELDEPVDSVEERMKRKRSSEFWRLATNLGSALALEKEIANTRNKKLSESEKRAVVMESLMVGIHEILENIKTEHEKLDEEARSDKVSLK